MLLPCLRFSLPTVFPAYTYAYAHTHTYAYPYTHFWVVEVGGR